jgi:serine/threonine protein kinase
MESWNFYGTYAMAKRIGQGGFGTVFAARRLSDSHPVAIKFVPKRRVDYWHKADREEMPLEAVLLQRAQAVPGVVRLCQYVGLSDLCAIVTERVEGDDLFDYVGSRGGLSELEAHRIFTQVLRTVTGLQECGIVHRDIKDENVMLESKTGCTKLIDFGGAALLNSGKDRFHDYHGTRVFAPPEWFTSKDYQAEALTIWQLGTLLFSMIHDDIPFHSDAQILGGRLCWSKPISTPCRDFISQCLQVDSSARPSLAHAASHEWVVDEMKRLREAPGECGCTAVADSNTSC